MPDTPTASTMRALTIHQPWALGVAVCGKVENRTWAPPRTVHEGDLVAIHASRTYDHERGTTKGRNAVFERLRELGRRPEFTFGAIIAYGRLGHAHFDGDQDCCQLWGEPGAWHWVFSDMVELAEPVACRGFQGLWTVPEDVAARVLSGPFRGRCERCWQPRTLTRYEPDHDFHAIPVPCEWCERERQPLLCTPCWGAEREREENAPMSAEEEQAAVAFAALVANNGRLAAQRPAGVAS